MSRRRRSPTMGGRLPTRSPSAASTPPPRPRWASSMRPAQVAPREVASLPARQLRPRWLAWSPDGRQSPTAGRIEAVARGINVLDVAENGTQRQVTHANAEADGIAFVVARMAARSWRQRVGCVRCDGAAQIDDRRRDRVVDCRARPGRPLGTSAKLAAWQGRDLPLLCGSLVSRGTLPVPTELERVANMPASQYGSLASAGGPIFFSRSPPCSSISSTPRTLTEAESVWPRRRCQPRRPGRPRAAWRSTSNDWPRNHSRARRRHAPFRRRCSTGAPRCRCSRRRRIRVICWSCRPVCRSASSSSIRRAETVSVVTLPESPWPPVGGPPPSVFDAAWSPRGDRIGRCPSGISVVSTAANTPGAASGGRRAAQLAWSPDGARLAIAERAGSAAESPLDSQAARVSPSPSQRRHRRRAPECPRGTSHGHPTANASLSPRAPGHRDVRPARWHDAEDGGASVGGLLWSPDGMRIAYAGICDGGRTSVPRGMCIVGHGGGPVLTGWWKEPAATTGRCSRQARRRDCLRIA